MKTCTKCKIEYPATAEYFHCAKYGKHGLCSVCKKCRLKNHQQYYQGCKQKRQEYQSQYRQEHRKKIRQNDKKRKDTKTIRGRAYSVISNIRNRCYNVNHRPYQSYGARGIRLCFTVVELLQWLNVKSINPVGLECHRIDNNGNYTLDNIEFLTSAEHGIKHRRKSNETESRTKNESRCPF